MQLSRQILLILVLASIGSIVQGLLQGRPLTGDQADEWAVTFSEARMMDNLLWIDARPETAFGEGHYPGALSLNDDNWDRQLGLVLEGWEPGEGLVVYCEGDGCASSRNLAQRLRTELGLERVYWLVDGWEAIQRAEEGR
jgi:rhodanese-related sulfurtransferase